MPKVRVLYHCTSYGHIGQIEEAVAEGARSMEGTVVSSSACSNWCLRRSLRNRAASLSGRDSRDGAGACRPRGHHPGRRMPSQMTHQTGSLWARGAFTGKGAPPWLDGNSAMGTGPTRITARDFVSKMCLAEPRALLTV